MSNRNEINPDAAILQQLAGQYDKMLALVVWKLAKAGVRITFADMQKFAEETESGESVLFTHGQKDAIEFSIVTADRAVELAEFDRKKSGGVQ